MACISINNPIPASFLVLLSVLQLNICLLRNLPANIYFLKKKMVCKCMEHNVIQGIKRLFHQLVYWTSATQILIVRK